MRHPGAPDGAWRDFVLDANVPCGRARTPTLGVVRADGSPHVSPVWVDLDVRLSTTSRDPNRQEPNRGHPQAWE